MATGTNRTSRSFKLFLESPYVSLATVSIVTADRYSRIAASLRAKGRPIPTNDIWIAAHAMETGTELVSFDQHFDNVDGLVWQHTFRLSRKWNRKPGGRHGDDSSDHIRSCPENSRASNAPGNFTRIVAPG